MDRKLFHVSLYNFDFYEGSRILGLSAFTVNPLENFSQIEQWIKDTGISPDHVRINLRPLGGLFSEDDRISNNVFYCNKF